MERTMAEKLTAEFVGALALIFVGAGSIVAAATGASNLVGVALAHGLVIARDGVVGRPHLRRVTSTPP